MSPIGGLESSTHSYFYQFDPTKDPRWRVFVGRHPNASVFHTVGWLKALQLTYGYEPVAFTTSPPTGELENGIVFCRVQSWLTGRRLVSLPFSDHCEPLCDSIEDLNFLIRNLRTTSEPRNWKYLEVRPVNGRFQQIGDANGFLPAAKYLTHVLDLRPDLMEVFRKLDKDSVQRRIRRAEHAGLIERCGRSIDLLEDFYGLFVMTRGRHRLPPIPFVWFQNLVQCLGNALEIRLAYKDKIPVSAILTLRFRHVVYYKYGCSDARFKHFGATPWLLWKAISGAKSNGAQEFDMGRTEELNAGLIAFKDHWVRQSEQLVYWKFPETSSLDSINGWKLKVVKGMFSCMPDRLRIIAGKLIYPHIG